VTVISHPVRARTICAGLLLALSAGCGGPKHPDHERTPDEQRVHDSILGASRVPGAAGVQKALKAVDSAAARRAREDSLAGQP
jgi:hypothetical protein